MNLSLSFAEMRMNIHNRVDRHTELALAQTQIDAQRAHLHIHNLIDQYRLEDHFKRRSEGQRRRWAAFHQFTKGEQQ